MSLTAYQNTAKTSRAWPLYPEKTLLINIIYTVKPRLSGLVRTGLNGVDNRNMNINEPRTKLNNLEKSK